MSEIQRFTTLVFQSIGGIVEPIEYALADVIIPDEYKEFFQNRSELRLAFDFEVASENLDSEFVTFGSDVFNNVLNIANTSAQSSIRYGIVDNLNCSNAETKILQSLHSESSYNARIVIIEQRPIIVPIALFNFRANFSSDFKICEDIEVWINLHNKTVYENLRSDKNTIFFEKSPVYNYPLGKKYSISIGFEIALQEAEKMAQNRVQFYYREDELQNELSRIKSYYSELEEENNKRLVRKGISDEKKAEILSKTESIKLECIKQVTEIKNKHSVKVKVNLMNGIIYHTPFVEYRYKLDCRNISKQLNAIYNPILKSFELS